MRRLGREPLVHFALAGAMLFGLHAAVGSREPPAPPAAGQEPSHVITVGESELRTLRDQFASSWKQPPSDEQLADLVEGFITDEVLWREGLRRGLERDDAIVRQRVIEKMRAVARPEPVAPSRAELETWFRTYAYRFVQAPRITFEQIYFDPKVRQSRGIDARSAAASALEQLADGGVAPAAVGDSFALSRRWDDTPEPQVAHVFGEAFAHALSSARDDRWFGPLASEYGAHLVRVLSKRPGRMPSFEEAENYVRADHAMAQNRALLAVERDLLPRYRVELLGPSAAALRGTAALRTLHVGARSQ